MAVCACTANARPSFLDTFVKHYRPAPGSELLKAECATCHRPNGARQRNPFGARLEAIITKTTERKVTDDILIDVESEDPDGDGYTNLEEIFMGSMPGDPKSHPSGHPSNLPKSKRKGRHGAMLFGAPAILVLGGVQWVYGRAKGNLVHLRLGLYVAALGLVATLSLVALQLFRA